MTAARTYCTGLGRELAAYALAAIPGLALLATAALTA